MKAISHFILSGTAALALTGFTIRLPAAVPPVTVTVEPQESNQMIYAPVGALTADDPATGRLWFSLKIRNHGGSSLTLTTIRVTLTGVDVSIPKNVEITAGANVGTSLAADEIITVPHPAAPTLTLRLYFSGNPTPMTLLSPLAPYTPQVAGGAYLYPADEGDIGPEQYFTDLGNAHGPGTQMWGSDWSVYRITADGGRTSVREGGSADTNEDRLGWGVPMRAMADGLVLRTSTGWIDNHKPGERAFQLMAEYDGEAISDVKVKTLSTTRAASLQRLPSGQVQLSVWNITNVGRQITRLGSSPLVPGETVSDMAIDALTSTRVVGLLRLSGNNNSRVVVWDILDDGLTVTQRWAVTSAGVREVSLAKLSSSRFATGVRTETGDLQVGVWEVDGTGLHSRATGSGGVATSICTTMLSGTRFASSLRSDSGALKVIVWDYVNGSSQLGRRGEATAENISRVAAAKNDGGKWVTAMCTSPGGVLKLARWFIASETAMSMTLGAELVTTTPLSIQHTALAIAPATGNAGTIHAATVSVLDNGDFKINGWGNDPKNSPNAYEYSAQNVQHAVGAVTHVSLDELWDIEFVAAVRTAGGTLKFMTWHWADGGGNNVAVLHGDCRVWYYHFQADSVDTNVIYPGATLAAGQVIGRMGNSGSSSGPHTHIHAERIHPDVIALGAQEVLARQMAGTLDNDNIGTRPVPFRSARAMHIYLTQPGGEGNPANAFSTLNGHGMYDASLAIRPRLNTRYLDRLATGQNPTGRKEVVPGTPNTGGPFRGTVAQAMGASPSGSRLYIRGGNYDETILLNKPMLMRRYDYYDTAGSVLIGR